MKYLLVALLTFCFSSCASKASMAHVRQFYSQGHFEEAEVCLNQMISQKSAGANNDAVWQLLDRAMVRFTQNDAENAIEDFKLALETIDTYNQPLFKDTALQILGEDASAPYKGDDFEQGLARLYFALCLLHVGDESNAFAILRQSEEQDIRKREAYKKGPLTKDFYLGQNAISKFLFALLLEKGNDLSNAAILKREAQSLCRRELTEFDPTKANVVVICHNGNAPSKMTAFSDASRLSMLALELLLNSQSIDPAVCSLTGIPVPELYSTVAAYPLPTMAALDTEQQLLRTWFDVRLSAQMELEQKMPVILARGAARLLLRRSAVGYLQEQNSFLGSLADFSMLVANSMTCADTRSWDALPMTIDLAIFQVDPDTYPLHIQSSLNGCIFSSTKHTIRVKKGDLCVVQVFNIHPGITKILIPERFLP